MKPEPQGGANAPQTLVQAFSNYITEADLQVAITVIGADQTVQDLTKAHLDRLADTCARRLQTAGVKHGDRVVLALPTSVSFLGFFWGALKLGAVVVPVQPGEAGRRASLRREQLAVQCALTRAKVLVVESGEQAPADVSSVILTPPTRLDHEALEYADPPGPDDLAVIQLTSGSTRAPRGCALSHAAMLANARAIAGRTGAAAGDVSVCWLPLHHDMGLMSGVITPVVSHAASRLQSATRFMANPLSWLHQLDDVRPAHTAVPNFALSLVLRRLRSAPPPALDLSRVKTLMCGAEPIDAALVRDLIGELARYGFQQQAFHAAYGMAESTVMAASRPGGLRSVCLQSQRLTPGAFVAYARPGPDVREVVSVGEAVDDGLIELADVRGDRVPQGVVGRVRLRSPSVMNGYFGDPEATSQVLKGGWLVTEDLGVVLADELYVLGRADDLIIVGGRNIHPADVEAHICAVLNIERNRVVTERRRRGVADELVVFVEARASQGSPDLQRQVRAATLDVCGIAPADVFLVPPGSVPRTSSGKVRRQALRRALAEGGLDETGGRPAETTTIPVLALSGQSTQARGAPSAVAPRSCSPDAETSVGEAVAMPAFKVDFR